VLFSIYVTLTTVPNVAFVATPHNVWLQGDDVLVDICIETYTGTSNYIAMKIKSSDRHIFCSISVCVCG
jgi:hypothetical protein